MNHETGARNGRATDMIERARRGDAAAIDELIGLVYPELKRRACWLMMGERPGHTFGPSGSELVQRVMEKILEAGGHIFSAAQTEEDLINMLTRRMRYILVDYARAVIAHNKPGPKARVPFEKVEPWVPDAKVNLDEVICMDEILTKLAARDPDAAHALELRFFAGLTNDEAASAMGLSPASFRRNLKRAMVFFKAAMQSAL
jgi:RNA polymerase sigma factor (TIGR02999 family)